MRILKTLRRLFRRRKGYRVYGNVYGNRPFKLVMPPDSKVQETRLYLGTIYPNGMKPNPDRKWWQFWKPKYIYEAPTENWSKADVKPITFSLQPVENDKFLTDMHTEILYRFKRDE